MSYSNEKLYLAAVSTDRAVAHNIANVEVDRGLLAQFYEATFSRMKDMPTGRESLYTFEPADALIIARTPADPHFVDADRGTPYMPAHLLRQAGGDRVLSDSKQMVLRKPLRQGLLEIEIPDWERPIDFDTAAMAGLLRALGVVSASGNVATGQLKPVRELEDLAAKQRNNHFFRISRS